MDLLVTMDYEEELDTEVEKLIMASNEVFTEAQLSLQIHRQFQKEKLAVAKPKKELRLGFQSPELRIEFEGVVRQVPGREEEARKVFSFLAVSENGNSTPLCLHGNTGCGKTSLIKKVMDFFQGHFASVKGAYINCMTMWSVTHVYSAILSTLFSINNEKRKSAAQVLFQQLQESHGRKNEPTKIVILD